MSNEVTVSILTPSARGVTFSKTCPERSRRMTRGRNVDNMTKNYYIYIMTNKSRVFYTGMTNNLERRVYEHKHKLLEGFTKKYNITQLVYHEVFSNVREAIAREKQVKDWRREKKIALIESLNPTWKDLSADWEK
jgi:putative endonuclease